MKITQRLATILYRYFEENNNNWHKRINEGRFILGIKKNSGASFVVQQIKPHFVTPESHMNIGLSTSCSNTAE